LERKAQAQSRRIRTGEDLRVMMSPKTWTAVMRSTGGQAKGAAALEALSVTGTF
jgi:hypothetical protein